MLTGDSKFLKFKRMCGIPVLQRHATTIACLPAGDPLLPTDRALWSFFLTSVIASPAHRRLHTKRSWKTSGWRLAREQRRSLRTGLQQSQSRLRQRSETGRKLTSSYRYTTLSSLISAQSHSFPLFQLCLSYGEGW